MKPHEEIYILLIAIALLLAAAFGQHFLTIRERRVILFTAGIIATLIAILQIIKLCH